MSGILSNTCIEHRMENKYQSCFTGETLMQISENYREDFHFSHKYYFCFQINCITQKVKIVQPSHIMKHYNTVQVLCLIALYYTDHSRKVLKQLLLSFKIILVLVYFVNSVSE